MCIITKELLQTIYNRAEQYFIAKTNRKLDRLELNDDGTIEAIYEYSRYGDLEEMREVIYPENLSEDLDIIIQKRKEQEEQERLIQIELNKKKEKEQKEREKTARLKLYNELRKEFE